MRNYEFLKQMPFLLHVIGPDYEAVCAWPVGLSKVIFSFKIDSEFMVSQLHSRSKDYQTTPSQYFNNEGYRFEQGILFNFSNRVVSNEVGILFILAIFYIRLQIRDFRERKCL